MEILPGSWTHGHLRLAWVVGLLPLPHETGRALALTRRHPLPAPRPRCAPLYSGITPRWADLAHSVRLASVAWLTCHHLLTLSIH